MTLPLMTPVIVSMSKTPVLAVGDAVTAPLPGRETPPRSARVAAMIAGAL
jgi:hypothetical protein